MTGLIKRFSSWLPVSEDTPIVSLEEGSTPLIQAPRLESILGNNTKVYLKFEGANPTGSFKDRGMTMAVSKAMESGSQGIICASTGNTSASAAAYGARAGVSCWVVLPAGKVAAGKLAQAIMHGAKIIAIDGNFDQALELVKEVAEKRQLTLVNSVNPYRLMGQQTASLEIIEELGQVPDAHFLPVGNAGNITAHWMGYKAYRDKNPDSKLPKMCGYQAEGAAPIVLGKAIENPKTLATAIRIGNPASWEGATTAASESSGHIQCVSDDKILEAYRHLASKEGVFCEPASAASVAGLLKSHYGGTLNLEPGSTIVCTLTGHGLKDPDQAIAQVQSSSTIPADIDKLQARMDSIA